MLGKNKLNREIGIFEKNRPDLLKKHPGGGFVVIKGKHILGVYKTRKIALSEGIKEFGNIVFLVKDIAGDVHSATNMINFSRDIEFA